MTDRIATAVIQRWIDGDTFVVSELDPGWGVTLKPTHPSDVRCHIRISGINTPDTNHNAKWYDPALAKAAAAYASLTWPEGTTIALTSHGFDSFGRTLADIAVTGGPALPTVDMGADLVAAGYARIGDYPVAPKEQ